MELSIGVFIAYLVISLVAYVFLVFVVVGCFSQRVSNIISFCIFVHLSSKKSATIII